MKTIFTDAQLGLITVHTNARSKRIIMRAQPDGIRMTVPPATPENIIRETLEKFRSRLADSQKHLPQTAAAQCFIDLHFSIHSDWTEITLEQGILPDFHCNARPGKAVIICPPDTDFHERGRQEWLHRVIERLLRQQAVWLLPKRLHELSSMHQLPFNLCKINVSKSRWGSCSIQRNINLSCYLTTLPRYLSDYVMLHELAHTIEMNHGPNFWALLNRLTEGKAQSLRHELRNHQPKIM